MARNEDRDKDETTADFDHVADMAKRLNLRGRERDKYIHNHMTGLGYRMVPSYVRPDDEDDDERSRFSFGRSRSGSRGSRDDDDDGFPF